MCGRYDLWPKRYVDEVAVAEMVCGRYGRSPTFFAPELQVQVQAVSSSHWNQNALIGSAVNNFDNKSVVSYVVSSTLSMSVIQNAVCILGPTLL